MSSPSVALVVGSAYERNGQLAPLPSAELDCELVERRLSDRDAGFRVFRFDAARGLAERVEQRLMAQSEPVERLVFYFSGYCAVSRSEGRTPGLILDGGRLGTFSLVRLRRLLQHYAQNSAVILDAALVSDRGESPRTTLRELGAILTASSSRTSALIAARQGDSPDSFGGSAFTGLFLMVVDWLVGARRAGQPVDLAWVFEGLKADPTFFQAIPAVGLFPERSRFVLVPGGLSRVSPGRIAEPARAPRQREPEPPSFLFDNDDDDGLDELDELTPPFALTRPPQAPSSPPEVLRELPAPPPARMKLPSFEPSPEVADALFEAGEFARAAEEYAAVLEFVSVPAVRAVLLAKQAQALAALGRANESGLILVDPPLELQIEREESFEGTRLLAEYETALSHTQEPREFAALLSKLDGHYRSGTSDPLRVARALEPMVALEPDNLALRDRIVELYTRAKDVEQALLHCRRAACLAPLRADTYRRALGLFEAAGVPDGAWNAASVLECLHAADVNEALLASQYRPEGLLDVRGSLASSEWESALLTDAQDAKVAELLAALGSVGIRAAVGFAKVRSRYLEPDPASLQDPERSTTTLAKTLGWTSRLLGLSAPRLYVVPDSGHRLDVGPTETASALASRNLASGLSLGELSFLWGRQLPRFRDELRALSFFRTPDELSMLLSAALALGECPGVSVRDLDAEAKRLYAAIRRELRGPAFDRLRLAARDFPSQELYARAEATLRGLELIGVRAGLVACGDVRAAAELLGRYPTDGLTLLEEQRAELFSFAISAGYSAIRQRIGVAIAA